MPANGARERPPRGGSPRGRPRCEPRPAASSIQSWNLKGFVAPVARKKSWIQTLRFFP